MVIWIDVLIVENFIVNFFLLYATAKTIKMEIKLKRIFCASILGSLYILTLIYPDIHKLSSVPFKITVALIMVFISSGKKQILINLKYFFVFMLYTMVLAGTCLFIQYSNGEYNFSSFGIINFSYKKLILSLMIIYMFIDRTIIYIKDRKQVRNLIYDIDIITKHSKKNVKAFLDTGNELREPATNLPVIIVEKAIFYDVNLKEYDKFYIPYKVVSGACGNLEGFKPESIEIHEGKDTRYTQAIVAFCDYSLSDLEDYHALLSRGVI